MRHQPSLDSPRRAEQADVRHGMPAAGVRTTADVDRQVAQPIQVEAAGGQRAADCASQSAGKTNAQAACRRAGAGHEICQDRGFTAG